MWRRNITQRATHETIIILIETIRRKIKNMYLKNIIILGLLLLGVGFACIHKEQEKVNFKMEGNPLVRMHGAADPDVHVWDDVVWMYCSQDHQRQEGDRGNYDHMDGYHAFSSSDMIHWTDHGEVLHTRDILRGYKMGEKYEGHMRMPTLAWWPGKIKPGSVTTEYASTIDILATIAALTGAQVPKDRVIDGKDISKLLFKPGKKSPHKAIFYEYEGVRVGDWKLLIPKKKQKSLGPPELYNLKDDIGEQINLAQQFPKNTQKLLDMVKAHQKYVQSAQRPAAFVDNPEPLLKDTTGIPSLAEYMKRTDIITYGDIYIN